jgi:hypothetical protein
MERVTPTHGRRAGALVMALDEPADSAAMSADPPPLNDTLRETERLTSPRPRILGILPGTNNNQQNGNIVTPAAYQRAMEAVREALGLSSRPVAPSESMGPHTSALMAHRRAVQRIRENATAHHQRAAGQELPAPAPAPAPAPPQYVRLAHVPRDPSQSPMDGATAMMRTWVLVDEEDLVPPPELPAAEQRNNPRPPLAQPTCCICMDEKQPCEVVFTGCGHMNTCLRCSQMLVKASNSSAAPCPLCRIKSRPLLVRVG